MVTRVSQNTTTCKPYHNHHRYPPLGTILHFLFAPIFSLWQAYYSHTYRWQMKIFIMRKIFLFIWTHSRLSRIRYVNSEESLHCIIFKMGLHLHRSERGIMGGWSPDLPIWPTYLPTYLPTWPIHMTYPPDTYLTYLYFDFKLMLCIITFWSFITIIIKDSNHNYHFHHKKRNIIYRKFSFTKRFCN